MSLPPDALALTKDGLALIQGRAVATLYLLADLYRNRNDAQERLEAVAHRIMRDSQTHDPAGDVTDKAVEAIAAIVLQLRGGA